MSNGPNSVKHPADDSAEDMLPDGNISPGCGLKSRSETLKLTPSDHAVEGVDKEIGKCTSKLGDRGIIPEHLKDTNLSCRSTTWYTPLTHKKSHVKHPIKKGESKRNDCPLLHRVVRVCRLLKVILVRLIVLCTFTVTRTTRIILLLMTFLRWIVLCIPLVNLMRTFLLHLLMTLRR